MNKIRLAILVAFVATVVSGQGRAGPAVTIDFDTPIFSAGSDNVHITFPGESGGVSTAHVAAGRFTGSATNLVDVDAGIFVDGVDRVFMYCYDLHDAISAGDVVPYAINFTAVMQRTLTFLGAVNAVLNEGKAKYDPYAWVRPTSTGQSAAIQLGLWESKYELEDNQWSMTGGSFSATHLAADTQSWIDSFFAMAATDIAPLEQKFTMVFESDQYQDMIAADPPSTVPAPGTLALLLLALCGFRLRRTPRPASA